MVNFEKPGGGSEERELPEEVIKLETALKQIAENLRAAGYPVDNKCRLDIGEYKDSGIGIEGVGEDENYVAHMEDLFAEQDLRRGGVEKGVPIGEQMEMFCAVLLNKFFDGKFIVVRASRFDDIKNGIDYVIFDPENGDIVGAFDAVVADEESTRFNEKEEKIMSRKGELKYGLGLDENGKIAKQSRGNIPLFYFDLKKEELKSFLRKINYEAPKEDQSEKVIFDEFLSCIKEQIAIYREFKPDWVKENKKIFEKLEKSGKQDNQQKKDADVPHYDKKTDSWKW